MDTEFMEQWMDGWTVEVEDWEWRDSCGRNDIQMNNPVIRWSATKEIPQTLAFKKRDHRVSASQKALF